MKTHFFFCLLAVIMLSLSINGQENQTSKLKFDPKRLIYGADIGLGGGFSTSEKYWSVGVSPQIGYKLTDKFHAGVGFGYNYSRWNQKNPLYSDANSESSRYVQHTASLNLFAHYYPWEKLIFSIRPEIGYMKRKVTGEKVESVSNKFTSALTIGGGLFLKPVVVQLNYDLIRSGLPSYNDNLYLSFGFLF